MPRNPKKAVDEFKIERIQESRDESDSCHIKQRSLVFRIFKHSVKSIETGIPQDTANTLAIRNSSTIAVKNTPEENSISYSKDQNELKNSCSSKEKCNKLIQCEEPLKKKIMTKESTELRRTSRRIVLRSNKDFIVLKKPGEVAVKRGRGRPRLNKVKPAMKPMKIHREVDDGTVWTLVPKEIIDTEYFKSQIIQVHYPQEKTNRRNSRFISLPPKTFRRTPFQNITNLNLSPYPTNPSTEVSRTTFQNMTNFDLSAYPANPSSEISRTSFQNMTNLDLSVYPANPSTEISRTPFQNMTNLDLSVYPENPNAELMERNQVLNIGQRKHRKSPPRPTVIFVKSPKKRSGHVIANSTAKDVVVVDFNNDFKPIGGLSTENVWQINYLRRNYGKTVDESAIEYIYGVSGGNIRKTEELLSDVISGKRLLITESDGQLRITDKLNYQLQVDEIGKRSDNTYPSLSDKSNFIQYPKASKVYPDTLYRQVIVDSIKLLYDEESVLG